MSGLCQIQIRCIALSKSIVMFSLEYWWQLIYSFMAVLYSLEPLQEPCLRCNNL